jgi:hypothetical protein
MIAEVPVKIRCRHQETLDFLAPYLSTAETAFTVEPADADLQRTQADLIRAADAEGRTASSFSAPFLERSAIHALLAEKIVEHDVLLMHGSALCMDGRGVLFTAKSGTGKSTHARLWREVFGDRVWMVNDDKPLLRIEETGVTVWGTPWNGKHRLSRNASAPLEAVVSLSRDVTNHIEPMAKADAYPVLMKQCFISRNPVTMARIMELEKRLLDAVDFYKLGCNMERSAALTAQEGIFTR